MKTKICIVDDHQLFARAISNIVSSFDDFEVHSILSSGEELVERFSSIANLPEMVLLDVNMPKMDGIETMKWLSENKPEIAVLALSMEDNDNTVLSMIKNGARGYILKDVHPDELKEALDCIKNKGFYHSELTNSLLLSRVQRDTEKEIKLSDREKDFIRLACSELTYKEIAAEMFLSPKTIDGYRDSLFKKLKVKSRTGLVIKALREKWVEL